MEMEIEIKTFSENATSTLYSSSNQDIHATELDNTNVVKFLGTLTKTNIRLLQEDIQKNKKSIIIKNNWMYLHPIYYITNLDQSIDNSYKIQLWLRKNKEMPCLL